MTRTSAVVQLAKADFDVGKEVRYSSINCRLEGKRGVLHASALSLVPHFTRYAVARGVGAHVTSILANHIAVSGAPLGTTDLFAFYGRVWGAVDRHFTSATNSAGQFDKEARTFFEAHPVAADMLPVLRRPTPVMVRQQDCVSLATAAYAHLQSFEARLRRYCVATAVATQLECGAPVRDEAKLGARLCACITAAPGDVEARRTALRTQATDSVMPGPWLRQVEEFVDRERDALGELLLSHADSRSGTTLAVAMSCTSDAKKKSTCHLLLPHMLRISNASFHLLRQYEPDHLLPPVGEDDADNADGDTCLPCEEDEEEGDRQASAAESQATRVWTRARRPRPCSALPVAKLRRAMAYYGLTEWKEMRSALFSENEAMVARCGEKRKRGEIAAARAEMLRGIDPLHLGADLFNFQKVKGKKYVGRADPKGRNWHLCNFRTNGVSAVLTFVSGANGALAAENTAAIIKTGYQIPKPEQPVDMRTARGLFRVTQSRNDLASEMYFQPGDQLVTVDPGFARPVQFAALAADALSDGASAQAVAAATSTWHYSKTEWMQQSGRDYQAGVERKRRQRNEAYGAALDSMSLTRRRCADADEFGKYAHAAMATLADRASELTATTRCLFRWKCARKLQSFLSRVADSAFARQSLRPKRQPAPSGATIEELRERRRERRAAPSRRAVFFGDGRFSSSMRGNPSMPKKKLLKYLAVRGLTLLLDEYRTSKCCPCGGDALKDLTQAFDGGKRVRVHQTGGGVCDVLRCVDDRDELATINMLLAAQAAVQHRAWPTHLLRPQRL